MMLFTSILLSLASPFAPSPYRHSVTVWIPPYAISKCKAQLAAPQVQRSLTHLDLQFWVPTEAGAAELTHSSPEVSSQSVAELRDWAHARGIRAMLCVFNGEPDWNWPLAKSAFGEHRERFTKSLVAEMDKHGLDGIDIDLEGPASYEVDKPAYVAFIVELSKQLHARHKQLTLDSFCYVWNAPNQGWWPDLFPHVDGITSMGYESTGVLAKDWASYLAQVAAAGKNVGKLQIGVPSDRDAWQGNTAVEQLTWIKTNGQANVSIWDAQLPAASWKSPDVWAILASIRNGR